MKMRFPDDASIMRHALGIAAQSIGSVEPNPAVGAVLVDDERNLIAEGFHEKYGGPHAEANALTAAGEAARGANLFVTLEPCCHYGKTPPCSQAVIAAGVKRVVVAMIDPSAHAAGGGIAELRAAGVAVDIGLCESEAHRLIAPFVTLTTKRRPFIHAKWAMTLDGKIASRTGHSKWISGPAAREMIHRLRGRMDAILVGAGTAIADDPLLTVRPPGLRMPVRIVVDSRGGLRADSQLALSARQCPVLLVVTEAVDLEHLRELETLGVETLKVAADETHRVGLADLMAELGRRGMTNVLVEGGGTLLGSLFDAALIDEVHVVIAPKLVGGADAVTPLGGHGLERIPERSQLDAPETTLLGCDFYLRGRIQRPETPAKETSNGADESRD